MHVYIYIYIHIYIHMYICNLKEPILLFSVKVHPSFFLRGCPSKPCTCTPANKQQPVVIGDSVMRPAWALSSQEILGCPKWVPRKINLGSAKFRKPTTFSVDFQIHSFDPQPYMYYIYIHIQQTMNIFMYIYIYISNIYIYIWCCFFYCNPLNDPNVQRKKHLRGMLSSRPLRAMVHPRCSTGWDKDWFNPKRYPGNHFHGNHGKSLS